MGEEQPVDEDLRRLHLLLCRPFAHFCPVCSPRWCPECQAYFPADHLSTAPDSKKPRAPME
jgi:hypothetical protein